MTSKLHSNQNVNEEELNCYLDGIHRKLESDNQLVIDLHTILWKLDYEVCPVCNDWLVMRSKPRLTK